MTLQELLLKGNLTHRTVAITTRVLNTYLGTLYREGFISETIYATKAKEIRYLVNTMLTNLVVVAQTIDVVEIINENFETVSELTLGDMINEILSEVSSSDEILVINEIINFCIKEFIEAKLTVMTITDTYFSEDLSGRLHLTVTTNDTVKEFDITFTNTHMIADYSIENPTNIECEYIADLLDNVDYSDAVYLINVMHLYMLSSVPLVDNKFVVGDEFIYATPTLDALNSDFSEELDEFLKGGDDITDNYEAPFNVKDIIKVVESLTGNCNQLADIMTPTVYDMVNTLIIRHALDDEDATRKAEMAFKRSVKLFDADEEYPLAVDTDGYVVLRDGSKYKVEVVMLALLDI